MEQETMEVGKARFVKGTLLTWIPLLLFLIPLSYAFRGISSQKATGLGAVAGGLSESLALLGLVAFVMSQLAAIVLLARALSRDHGARSFFSLLSICCSVLMLTAMGVVMWLIAHYAR